MHTPNGRSALPLLVFVALLAAACSTSALAPRAFLAEGDQDSARVGYSGNLDDATAVARGHCAAYERVPHFVAATMDMAYFDCVAR